jgi:hypothetical protein
MDEPVNQERELSWVEVLVWTFVGWVLGWATCGCIVIG